MKSKTMSQQLREAIDASDLSRYRICKSISLPESTMSNFMTGRCGLALATVDRLGKLLGLRISAHAKAKAKTSKKTVKHGDDRQ
jgi:plasmid maintenance system antidote protein VapI